MSRYDKTLLTTDYQESRLRSQILRLLAISISATNMWNLKQVLGWLFNDIFSTNMLYHAIEKFIKKFILDR